MARSDPNSPEPSGRMHDRGKARHSSGSGLEEEDRTIHSGHFMLSRVHDGESENEDDSLGFSPDNRGFDFFEATKSPPKTYSFGARSTQTLAIDASLTKLFQCMTLAYSGKITSPKWKPFKGMPLSLKDKVRLNNIIWREWPMQYIYGRKSVVCQFATPVSDDVHTKPEAVVLEGKYWKRRLDTVTAEYKKWRKYYKERVLFNPPEVSITEQNIVSHNDLLDRLREVNQALPRPQTGQVDMNLLSDEDFIMDFSDTLFTTLNQPFAFPNPRELSQSGYADIIQPGLMQLQPNLDDLCMDTFEPLQEMFNLRQQQATGPALFTASSRSNQLDTSSFLGQGDSSITSNLNLPMELLNNLGNSASGSLQQQQNQALMNAALSSLATQMQLPNFNFSSSQFSPSQSMDLSPSLPPTDTQMIVDAPDPQSQFSPVPQTQNVATHNHQKTRNSSLTKGTNSRIKSMNTQSNFPSQGKPRAAQSANKQSGQHSVHNKPSSGQSKKMSHSAAKSVSAGKPTFSGDSTEKKEVSFAVPKGKPVSSRMKQRAIAPAPALQASPPNVNAAPSSNVAQKNTYLAQLLTTGNYPGAVIKVKNEPQGSLPQCVSGTSPAVPPFRPLTTSPSTSVAMQTPIAVCQPIVPAPSGIALVTNVGDFPASVLIAAASQALGTNTASVKDAVSIAHSTRLTGKIASTIPTPAPSLAHSLLSTSAMPSSPSSLPSHGSPASVSSPPPPDFSMASSPSPSKTSVLPKSENSSPPHREERKRSHISAEQKRRGNIKSGFDVIHAIIPSLSQNPNAKVSKAAMLQKTAEYCKKLKSERTQMQNEAEILKQEIESLNSAINTCQLQLPATGVPITRQRADKMRELFDDYVKNRTLLNWKFWIFSSIIRCLFESYNSMVSTVSLDELCRTVLAWLDQHCSLVSLRPTVLNSLRHLSTTTSILSDPSKVPDQVTQAVTRQNQPKPPGDT